MFMSTYAPSPSKETFLVYPPTEDISMFMSNPSPTDRLVCVSGMAALLIRTRLEEARKEPGLFLTTSTMEGPGARKALNRQAVHHSTIPHPNPALGLCCTNLQLDQVVIVLE